MIIFEEIFPKHGSIASAPNSVYVEQLPIFISAGPIRVRVGGVVSIILIVLITGVAATPAELLTL